MKNLYIEGLRFTFALILIALMTQIYGGFKAGGRHLLWNSIMAKP
jgi:hypothetical protein